MSAFLSAVLRFVLRLGLLLAGLVVVASVVLAASLAIAIWLVRRVWARLTGQPVTPLVFKVTPRAQWSRFSSGDMHLRGAPRSEDPAVPVQRVGPLANAPGLTDAGDITDVEPKPPRS